MIRSHKYYTPWQKLSSKEQSVLLEEEDMIRNDYDNEELAWQLEEEAFWQELNPIPPTPSELKPGTMHTVIPKFPAERRC